MSASPAPRQLNLDGTHKSRLDKGRSRIVIAMLVFACVYAVIAGRLVQLALHPEQRLARATTSDTMAVIRPDVLDRNGLVLATDVRSPSLFAEPRRMIDPDEAAEQLAETLPGINVRDLREKLASNRGFVWVRREITPRERDAVHRLGLPGVGFIDENRRVYPNGRTASHVLGHVNVDNQGIAGLERWVDQARQLQPTAQRSIANRPEPVRLALDLRVQHAVRDELADAIQRYRAIAAAGVVMDAHSGEIVAMVSLPDYDPNDPREALLPDRINRVTTGTFEMGSTMKSFTAAMALDSGRYSMSDRLDARAPLSIGGYSIDDYRGQRRWLDFTEAFTFSSNIASARMALVHGGEHHRAFLNRFGFFDRLRTELPESAEPQHPRHWVPLSTATISFGHGMTVAPLQAVQGGAALVNGGLLVRPTFLARSREEARADAVQILRPQTSMHMRTLFRANVERGTARRADVEGFLVGGKTGTSEKVVNGVYAKDKRLTSFLAAFPMDEPRYVVLVMLDEPQRVPETNMAATAGVNAAPTAGRIIARIGPLLGVQPRIDRIAGSARTTPNL